MIHLSAYNWLTVVILLIAVLAILLGIIYKKTSHAPRNINLAFILKFIAGALILLCILDPQIIRKEPVKGATSFLLLSDNSSSMILKGKAEEKSKGDLLKDFLQKGQNSWIDKLKNDFDFHHFSFDQRLREIDNHEQLKFDGKSTSINKHLSELRERYETDKTGAILLITDGRVTDKDLKINYDGLPPIYPVIIPDKSAVKDIAIQNIASSVSAFEDAPIEMRVEVKQSGYDKQELTLELLNEKNKTIQIKKWTANRPIESLRLKPQDNISGIRFYTVRVYATSEKDQFKNNTPLSEISLKNNIQTHKVDRRGGPYKVLYVSGRPNWEYKFLARSIESDNKIQLRALIRLAKRQEKFAFRPGGRNTNVNPLFQALDDDKAQQGENYDEPVFMRINTEDEKELEKGFPNTAEELFKYHAIIIDDCEASFFTNDQLSLIRDFTSKRGGSVLMLAGMESLIQGNYEKSPLKEILPVYLNKPRSTPPNKKKFKLDLTREGWLTSWVRLHDNEEDEEKRLLSMPDFKVLNRTSAIKPGATTLANVIDSENNKYPALITQKYGLGRTAVFTVGDFWRWGMMKEKNHQNLGKAWRQMLRWLTAEVPPFIDLKVSENKSPYDPIKIEYFPRDNSFDILEKLKPIVEITQADGSTLKKELTPDQEKEGLYTANVYPTVEGLYKVAINLNDEELADQGNQNSAFSYQKTYKEDTELGVDKAFFEELANKSNGKILSLSDVEKFVTDLPEESFKVTIEKSISLWNRGWILALIISLLAADWWLRRTKGMP
ncbi:MAG: hypothetical protein NE334_13955 [Lentisphaeraceae bacterium]|nr:hypothetical protein [Lentisphaeraceae bacterium]